MSIAPYFSQDVLEYNQNLCRAIEYALNQIPHLNDVLFRRLANIVWIAHQYLSGSVFREAPFEVQYCINMALNDWKKKPTIITTALMDEPFGYHFRGLDPWAEIKAILPNFDAQAFDRELALIGLPRLYRHKPLFCTPLYHELGHFVDKHWGITNMTKLLLPQFIGRNTHLTQINTHHWAEYFADLFAASYIGRSSVSALQIINPNSPESRTHPSNSARMLLVDEFLAGQKNPIIDSIKETLSKLGAPPLTVRYTAPDIRNDYDNLCPYVIESDKHMHGIFESANDYFLSRIQQSTCPWTNKETNLENLEKVINDLTEKSIRSYSIKKYWNENVSS